MSVSVSAPGKAFLIGEYAVLEGAPSIVTVIPRVQIQSQGYTSIADALREVPGLYILDDLATPNVAVRGIYGGTTSWNRVVKVLIDGIPTTFYSEGGSFLGIFHDEAVRDAVADRVIDVTHFTPATP